MRITTIIQVVAAAALAALIAGSPVSALKTEVRHDLRILILAKAGSDRAEQYRAFLAEHFETVVVADKNAFEPSQAAEFDIVLLDWRQDEIDHQGGGFAALKSPLGERAEWSKPTVLLGSAGLLLSAPWQTSGSYG
jgi:hypothetical protein